MSNKWDEYFNAAISRRDTGDAPVECPDCHSLHTFALVRPAVHTVAGDDVLPVAAAPVYQCSECGWTVPAD
jgi:hypothetical protein